MSENAYIVFGFFGLALLSLSWILCNGSTKKKRLTTKLVSEKKLPTTPRKAPEPTSIDLDIIQPQPSDWSWQTQKEAPYRPWHDGPYHVTMGLKNADVSNWIELDQTYLKKYQLKKSLFESHRSDKLQVLAGCDEAAFEALYLLRDVLVRRYPNMFCLLRPNVIQNLVTGDVWNLDRNSETWHTHHPLEVMSLLSTEDFFILQTDDEGVSRLRAGAVCFPAGWKIRERIGYSLWQIHAGNVPQYEEKLSKSMDRFFVKLRVGGSISRFNYAIDISDELFHTHSHHNLRPENLEHELSVQDLYLRVERQVLQRLPKTRALLFTIRTYITPIPQVTEDLKIARALRTSVGSYTPDVAHYKNKGLWNDVLQAHLNDILKDTEQEREIAE